MKKIMISVLLCMCLVGGISYFIVNNKKNSQEKTNFNEEKTFDEKIEEMTMMKK